jgi:hypothetical protein
MRARSSATRLAERASLTNHSDPAECFGLGHAVLLAASLSIMSAVDAF